MTHPAATYRLFAATARRDASEAYAVLVGALPANESLGLLPVEVLICPGAAAA
ncbi:MAG: hypothetical protein JW751_10745 [Polyangiaceae bacterium]|nr:hypothetical protein [Polyangiaceae bacterium]